MFAGMRSREFWRGTMLLFAGVFVVVALVNVSPAVADEDDDDDDVLCPCFTSEMIDAALVSVWGDYDDDDFECVRTETGVDFVVLAAGEDTEMNSELSVGAAITQSPVLGRRLECFLELNRNSPVEGGPGNENVKAELDVNEVTLSPRELAACRREVENSFTWRRFCVPILPPDDNDD